MRLTYKKHIMKKVFRSIQTLFPYLHDLRFSLMLAMIRLTKVPHEKDFHAVKMFRPKPDQVFIDVGSNRGEAISSMLTANHPNQIIGFEPNPLIFEKLRNLVRQNDHVTVHNYGLGSKNQDLTLYVPFYRKWMFDGLGSFKYEAARDWLKSRMWQFDEKKLTVRELDCKIRKLDDFKLKPYFIKIDVQGFELEVLKGGRKTIEANKPILLIESASQEVKKFLEQLGYRFFGFTDGELVEGIGGINTFCLTPERYTEIAPEEVISGTFSEAVNTIKPGMH